MLNILFLDRKYISFTYDFRRYILPFLLALCPFLVDVGGERIWITPRSSDWFTIYEIYRDGDYAPKLPYTPAEIKTIVDFGANIGVFSLWASRFFPAPKIYAVEMEDSNYDQLLANIAVNRLQETIIPVQVAIFSESGSVGIRRLGGLGFHTVNVEEKTHTVKALSLADFLSLTQIETIDLLKIDIEGGEKYLLTPENEEVFRNRVGYVFLESHSVNDFRTEHGVEYLQKLGFEITLTPTPYVIDHNRIIDARNPALCGSDQQPTETLEQLEAGYNEITKNAKERTLAGSPGD
ncbi:MAG: FkbM family methyltransferase [Anaerolineales bacterium]